MIKILVIDDEAGICENIKQIFTYIGFSVFTATTAKKALSVFEKEKPKIIFLDIIMPDVDGLELLKRFKELDPTCIVMMVTASQDEKVKEKALQLGADEFIRKPFSRNYLRDFVMGKIKDILDKGGHMQKPNILIVDDEVDIREGMEKFLSPRYECNIELAGDGDEAIRKAKELKPDVVFLDIKMPGISGLDVIDAIKKINPAVKIIVISAWKSSDVVSQAIARGAVDYIGKPVSLAALSDKLQSILISIGKLIVKKRGGAIA
jgi:YesN/AraC family two-component response regulator